MKLTPILLSLIMSLVAQAQSNRLSWGDCKGGYLECAIQMANADQIGALRERQEALKRQTTACELSRVNTRIENARWFLEHVNELQALEAEFNTVLAEAQGKISEYRDNPITTLSVGEGSDEKTITLGQLIAQYQEANQNKTQSSFNPEQVRAALERISGNLNASLRATKVSYRVHFSQSDAGVELGLVLKVTVAGFEKTVAVNLLSTQSIGLSEKEKWLFLSAFQVGGKSTDGLPRLKEFSDSNWTSACIIENLLVIPVAMSGYPFVLLSEVTTLRLPQNTVSPLQLYPEAPSPIISLSAGADYAVTRDGRLFKQVNRAWEDTGNKDMVRVDHAVGAIFFFQKSNSSMEWQIGSHEPSDFYGNKNFGARVTSHDTDSIFKLNAKGQITVLDKDGTSTPNLLEGFKEIALNMYSDVLALTKGDNQVQLYDKPAKQWQTLPTVGKAGEGIKSLAWMPSDELLALSTFGNIYKYSNEDGWTLFKIAEDAKNPLIEISTRKDSRSVYGVLKSGQGVRIDY